MLELRCYVAIVVGERLDNAQSSEHDVDYSLETEVDGLQTVCRNANLHHRGNKLVQLVADVHQKTPHAVLKEESVD